jgi:hypothetical protein
MLNLGLHSGGAGHKDTPLAQLSDTALMCTLNFPDTASTDFSPTRQAIRDHETLTRMIREYGGDCTLSGLQVELLQLVRLTAIASAKIAQ